MADAPPAQTPAQTPAAIPVVMNDQTHRFEAHLDGETAFTEYRMEPGVMIMPHTVVPPAFEGRGVGSALAKTALGYARDHGLKIKPYCPFIAAYLSKHPEWRDVVHEDFLAKLGL